MRLFGCEYREGRPDGAPELREGSGTQAGSQLLAVDASHQAVARKSLAAGRAADKRVTALMRVEGHEFPMELMEDGQQVPEAWSYDQLLLPHLQPEQEKLFPRAVAAQVAGDCDPPARSLMGDRWARDCTAGEQGTETTGDPHAQAVGELGADHAYSVAFCSCNLLHACMPVLSHTIPFVNPSEGRVKL